MQAHQKTDKAGIRRALELFYRPGDVFELRILDTRQRTVSGYFDTDHLDEAVEAAARHMCQWTRIVTRLVNPNCYEYGW